MLEVSIQSAVFEEVRAELYVHDCTTCGAVVVRAVRLNNPSSAVYQAYSKRKHIPAQ